VTLTATDDVATILAPATGLMVYNTTASGNGTTAVVPGVYIYNGTNWVHSAMHVPVITTQPAKFTFSRLLDPDGDPNGPAATGTTLTVAAANATAYQWYRVSNNNYTADMAIDDKPNGSDQASYTFTPAGTGKANWGLTQFYCIVSNNSGSVKSEIAEVAYGCGAKTNDNRWIRFMCHNLGAATVTDAQALDEVTVGYTGTRVDADTLSSDAKGWWFQWGRQADGHQWRNTRAATNPTFAGPIDLGTDVTIPSANAAYGKFITNSARATAYDWLYPQYDYLWRNWNDSRFPCPSGWRVPSSAEWGTIYRGGGQYGTPTEATSNVWAWSDNPRGYKIQPNGSTTTLFLPAAGWRNNTGIVDSVGSYGNYWSSTTAASGAYHLIFSSTRVSPELSSNHAHGFSVRCLAE
jgi:uncharacterized protein (TIGR02145 family)